MRMIRSLIMACVGVLAIAGAALAQDHSDCMGVNAAGSAGYVNIRQWPGLYAPVVTRLNNPSHGSDWGSAYWCGEEVWDSTEGGRTWSKVYFYSKSGNYYEGWASDKVLQFVD
jgi:hypothetical protein